MRSPSFELAAEPIVSPVAAKAAATEARRRIEAVEMTRLSRDCALRRDCYCARLAPVMLPPSRLPPGRGWDIPPLLHRLRRAVITSRRAPARARRASTAWPLARSGLGVDDHVGDVRHALAELLLELARQPVSLGERLARLHGERQIEHATGVGGEQPQLLRLDARALLHEPLDLAHRHRVLALGRRSGLE